MLALAILVAGFLGHIVKADERSFLGDFLPKRIDIKWEEVNEDTTVYTVYTMKMPDGCTNHVFL